MAKSGQEQSAKAAEKRVQFDEKGVRPGITSCVIKPAATYAEATARLHSPAASAGV